MPKTSIKGAMRQAVLEDKRVRKAIAGDGALAHPVLGAVATDSFQNLAQKLGIGADNPLSTSSYGFNPITRNRMLLEWIHRGSWLGGVAVDIIADDMTRQGVRMVGEMPQEDQDVVERRISDSGTWASVNETIKWGRLYGGCIGVILIDGQDLRSELRVESVGKEQYKGIIALDRWMVEPSLEDLVTDYGPHLGLPKFYRVGINAPALQNKVVHHSRVAFRIVGVKLPFNQAMTEMLWGISVLERLYDRMIAFDSASTGAAQLVYKSYLRTYKVDGLREVAGGNANALNGLVKQMELMRRYQGIEGITLVDMKDEFEAQVHGAFSGLSDVISSMAEQISGALGIPMTRLFGQSPKGFSNDDNSIRNYHDKIKQHQESDLRAGALLCYQCAAQSEGITVPDHFALQFNPLGQLTATDKATIAKTITDTVLAAREAAQVSDKTVLQELRAQSAETGIWTNITTEQIDAADEEIPLPAGEGMFDPATGESMFNPDGSPKVKGQDDTEPKPAGEKNVRPEGKTKRVAPSKSR